MYTEQDFLDAQNEVLKAELALWRAQQRLDAAPWVEERKREVKTLQEALRGRKRALEQMAQASQMRLF